MRYFDWLLPSQWGVCLCTSVQASWEDSDQIWKDARRLLQSHGILSKQIRESNTRYVILTFLVLMLIEKVLFIILKTLLKRTFLGHPLLDYLTKVSIPISNWLIGLRGTESLQRHKSKNANAAFLTLSRYITHQRWIWSIQNCPSVTLSTQVLYLSSTSVLKIFVVKEIFWLMISYFDFQVISRILNTLCKLRIHEGFTFAHSSNGIQNMVVEVAMEQQEEGQLVTGDSPTCVLQYIIFPPHTTSSGKSSPRASKKTCIKNWTHKKRARRDCRKYSAQTIGWFIHIYRESQK